MGQETAAGTRLLRCQRGLPLPRARVRRAADRQRSEEHTSELQSPCNLVCRHLLENKTEPDVIDVETLLLQLSLFRLELRRIGNQALDQDQRNHSDRYIDVENLPPGHVVGYQPAELR